MPERSRFPAVSSVKLALAGTPVAVGSSLTAVIVVTIVADAPEMADDPPATVVSIATRTSVPTVVEKPTR